MWPRTVGRFLVERGAALTPHVAAGLGLVDRLAKLLSADPSLIDAKGGDGCTPPPLRSRGSRIDPRAVADPRRAGVSRFLLERGATPKQSLRIKTFIGTSENAVRTQIWTALIAMLLVRYLQLRATWTWSLSNLVALLRQQLFVYRNLWKWLNQPFQPPVEDSAQLELDLGG
ncbi:MAG: hypothetical protein HYR60_07640 [Acidobacteria bacterium]|nr:hypothetical protein [Acidobacteriota bacterium]